MSRLKQILALSVLAFTAGMGAMTAVGQSVTQGAITGTVEDPTGAAVARATVTIVNTATNQTITLTADDKGFFNAPLLQPGEYKVTISAPGFSQYVAAQVTVQVGQSTTLQPHLNTGNASETVEVSEAAPTVNLESPDFSNVLTSRAIQQIPENNRRWSSLALLTPSVVSDANGFGLIAVRGISPLLNNVLIDGADDNQAYFSEERGRTREAYSTSEDAVREFQVNAGVYQAEFGRAAGAVINSVTVSGTNKFHGEAYIYDRNSGWAAFTPLVTNTTATANGSGYTFNSFPIKPKDLRKIYGFSAGGPLIKDKFFWHYVYDQQTHIFPGIGKPANPSVFFTQPDAALPSGQTCNLTTGLVYTGAAATPKAAGSTIDNQACVLAAREKLASYGLGVTNYNNGLASLIPDLGLVPRTGYQEINTPKLDYNVTSKEHLSLLYHRLRWDSPGGVQTQATVPYAIDTFGNDFVKLDYGLAKLESQVTSTISNELGYQYSRELDYETQQPYSQYTLSNLVGTGPSAGNVPYVNLATASGFNLGSPYYSYRVSYPDERKWQVFDTAYMVKGNHTIKFGGDALHNYDLINNTFESNGDYSYTFIGNYFTDLYNRKNGLNPSCNSTAASTASVNATTGAVTSAVGAFPCFTSYFQGFGSPEFAIGTLDYSLFAQDNWKVTPRLTLELGVRYDYEILPQPFANLVTATGNFTPYPGLTNRPSDKNNIGPRIGFAYDIFGGGQTVLRGGYGIFYGRMLNGTILNTYLGTGSPNGQTAPTYKANTTGAPLLPNLATAQASGSLTSYYFAKNFQNPEIHEFDLILQQQFGPNTVFNIQYLGSMGRELPNFLNLNLNPATTGTGAVTNDLITVVDTTGKSPIPNGTQIPVLEYNSYGNQALWGQPGGCTPSGGLPQTVASCFQNITQVTSNVNSSYHAFVAQIESHAYHGLEMNFSYTWSHALDFAQNANTSTVANGWYDPYGNYRVNYGNSNYNVPNRFTGFVLYNFPNLHGDSLWKYAANNWSLNDDFQMQNGLPISAGTSGFVGNGIVSGPNGSGGGAFFPLTGRNTFRLPRDIVDDVRVSKGIPFSDRYNLELRADVFNVANHQNVSSVGTTAFNLSSTGATTGTATYSAAFRVPTMVNSSGFLYTPREIQVSGRFTF